MVTSISAAADALRAAVPEGLDVNLWGALGCAVTFAAALFGILDALGDYAQSRSTHGNPWSATGVRLKIGSKIAASGVGASAAGIVLAIDANWWTLAALVVVFVVVIGWSALALRKTAPGHVPQGD